MLHWLLHWLAVHTGTVNEPGPYYGFFSGFGSDLSELALLAGVIGLLRKHNCAVHRCWRIGRHPVAGTTHTVCRRHHPDPAVREGLRAHHILHAHQKHREQAGDG